MFKLRVYASACTAAFQRFCAADQPRTRLRSSLVASDFTLPRSSRRAASPGARSEFARSGRRVRRRLVRSGQEPYARQGRSERQASDADMILNALERSISSRDHSGLSTSSEQRCSMHFDLLIMPYPCRVHCTIHGCDHSPCVDCSPKILRTVQCCCILCPAQRDVCDSMHLSCHNQCILYLLTCSCAAVVALLLSTKLRTALCAAESVFSHTSSGTCSHYVPTPTQTAGFTCSWQSCSHYSGC